jgi:hypothetical protein
MTKRILFCTLAVLLVAGIAAAGEKAKSEKAKAGENAYVGWVTDTNCGAKGANPGHAECAKLCVKNKGAKFALYTPADGKVYVLAPQSKAEEHVAQHVKVKGTLDGDTLKIASIEMTGEQQGMEKKEKEKMKM